MFRKKILLLNSFENVQLREPSILLEFSKHWLVKHLGHTKMAATNLII